MDEVRNIFHCVARGCDGCSICEPYDPYIYDAMPRNEERLEYLDKPELEFRSTKDFKYHQQNRRWAKKDYDEKKARLLPSDSEETEVPRRGKNGT